MSGSPDRSHIGEAALDNSGIKEVILGGNTGLVAETFRNCPNLESVVVENSVKELSAGLFRYCVNLQSLELPFPGAGSASNVSNFGQLFGTTPADGMRAVVLESESGEKATYYLPANLRKLVLSEGCEMIPYGGLYNCNMLDTLVLPTTLYMVGDKALYGCSKLKDIFCKGADPAAAYDETFTGVRVSSCKLHIPYNTTDLYRRSPGWENFYYFEEEAPIAIVVEKTIEYAGVIYGLDEYRPGQTAELRAVAHHGYRFEGWMENDELITTDADLTFTVTGSRSLVARFVPVPDEGAIGVTPQPDGVSLHLDTVEGASSYVADIYADESLSVLVTSATTDVSTARSTRQRRERQRCGTVRRNHLLLSPDGLFSTRSRWHAGQGSGSIHGKIPDHVGDGHRQRHAPHADRDRPLRRVGPQVGRPPPRASTSCA